MTDVTEKATEYCKLYKLYAVVSWCSCIKSTGNGYIAVTKIEQDNEYDIAVTKGTKNI